MDQLSGDEIGSSLRNQLRPGRKFLVIDETKEELVSPKEKVDAASEFAQLPNMNSASREVEHGKTTTATSVGMGVIPENPTPARGDRLIQIITDCGDRDLAEAFLAALAYLRKRHPNKPFTVPLGEENSMLLFSEAGRIYKAQTLDSAAGPNRAVVPASHPDD